MIRSETAEQMARRIERQQHEGKVFMIQSPNGRPSAPPRPEAPQPGIVRQMRQQIERKS